MLGERLKAVRKAKGITQRELAQLIGVSEGAVKTWEQETSEPTAGALVSIAVALGVSIDYIVWSTVNSKKLVIVSRLHLFINLSESDIIIEHSRIDSIGIRKTTTSRFSKWFFSCNKNTLAGYFHLGNENKKCQSDGEGVSAFGIFNKSFVDKTHEVI